MPEYRKINSLLVQITPDGDVDIYAVQITGDSPKAGTQIMSSDSVTRYQDFPDDMPGNVRVFLAVSSYLGLEVESMPNEDEGGLLN